MNQNAPWRGKTLAVIGGGNMAEALLRGVIASGLLPAADIIVYDILPARRGLFAALGCRTVESPEHASAADAILLATKPKDLGSALHAFTLRPGRVLLSILAGVPSARIESLLPPESRVVRVMPNTPLLVGKGMTCFAGGARATEADKAMTQSLFACRGDAVEVDETMLDAVTALSGSGPAYLFRFAETLMAAGEAIGLPPALAKRLAIGTLAGAAEMLARDGDAATLRRNVTSPGGTTAAALAVLDEGDFDGLVARALAAARDRGAELGRG